MVDTSLDPALVEAIRYELESRDEYSAQGEPFTSQQSAEIIVRRFHAHYAEHGPTKSMISAGARALLSGIEVWENTGSVALMDVRIIFREMMAVNKGSEK